MKYTLLFIINTLVLTINNAQVKVTNVGKSSLTKKVELTIIFNKIYAGDVNKVSVLNDVLFTFNGDKIIKGDGANLVNVPMYFFDGNKLCLGDGTNKASRVLYYLDGNNIRKGDASFLPNDVVFIIDGLNIREGYDKFLNNKIVYTLSSGGLSKQQILFCIFLLSN